MLLSDLGVETVLAGFEFAHRDDYEGREVIPTIVEDADLKNIEVIEVEKVEGKYKEFKSEEELEELKKTIVDLENYDGMMPDMAKGSIVVDDLNEFEQEAIH